MDTNFLPSQVRQYIDQAIQEGRYTSVEDFIVEAAQALIAEELEDIHEAEAVLAQPNSETIPVSIVMAELGL